MDELKLTKAGAPRDARQDLRSGLCFFSFPFLIRNLHLTEPLSKNSISSSYNITHSTTTMAPVSGRLAEAIKNLTCKCRRLRVKFDEENEECLEVLRELKQIRDKIDGVRKVGLPRAHIVPASHSLSFRHGSWGGRDRVVISQNGLELPSMQ